MPGVAPGIRALRAFRTAGQAYMARTSPAMTLRKRILRIAICFVALLVTPAAHAADKVVAGSLGGQAPRWAIYVAVHKGFFKAEGLDLELIFAQSGAAVTQQLTAGSLDVALSVGITDPIHAIDKGASLAMI